MQPTTEQIQFIRLYIRSKYYASKATVMSYEPENNNYFDRGIPREHNLFDDGYLQLRSIEALTDDDAIQVAKMMGLPKDYGFEITRDIGSRILVEWTKYSGITIWKDCEFTFECSTHNQDYKFAYDYLTQIGIALPHLIILPNGETFTASVEWQVEQGIIKLTK